MRPVARKVLPAFRPLLQNTAPSVLASATSCRDVLFELFLSNTLQMSFWVDHNFGTQSLYGRLFFWPSRLWWLRFLGFYFADWFSVLRTPSLGFFFSWVWVLLGFPTPLFVFIPYFSVRGASVFPPPCSVRVSSHCLPPLPSIPPLLFHGPPLFLQSLHVTFPHPSVIFFMIFSPPRLLSPFSYLRLFLRSPFFPQILACVMTFPPCFLLRAGFHRPSVLVPAFFFNWRGFSTHLPLLVDFSMIASRGSNPCQFELGRSPPSVL